jgi:rubrerythrin
MASIFEELMAANAGVPMELESAPQVPNRRKIKANQIKVESKKILEDSDEEILAKEFEVPAEDSDEVVLVIDPELPSDEEVPEDAAKELVGDLVYKCPVCGSNYVCDCDSEALEGIEVDEDGAPLECPVCGDDADQILVGGIAPVDEVEVSEVDETEVVDESTCPDCGKPSDECECTESSSCKECDDKSVASKVRKSVRKMDLEEDDLGSRIDKYQKWVDYDMKRYGRVSSTTNSLIRKAGLQLIKDQYGGYEVSAGPYKAESKFGRKSIRESDDFVTDEIVDDYSDDAEIISIDTDKLEDEDDKNETKIKIKDSCVNFYFDEKRFESLMTKVLRENYKGTPSIKVNRVVSRGSRIRIEYTIRNKGSRRRGILSGTGLSESSRFNRLSLSDNSGIFTKSKSPSFVVEAHRIGRSLLPTKISYNYRSVVNESVYRVRGSVR